MRAWTRELVTYATRPTLVFLKKMERGAIEDVWGGGGGVFLYIPKKIDKKKKNPQ
jgi:hypothetical protein